MAYVRQSSCGKHSLNNPAECLFLQKVNVVFHNCVALASFLHLIKVLNYVSHFKTIWLFKGQFCLLFLTCYFGRSGGVGERIKTADLEKADPALELDVINCRRVC